MQLLAQAPLRLRALARRAAAGAVAILQARLTELDQTPHRARILRARIAVAEIAAQVEAQRLGQVERLAHRLGVIGETSVPSPRACSARGCGCRAAAARRPRAWSAGAAPRTRPAAPRASGRGRARRRWPRTSPPAAVRARPAPGCAHGRGGRRGAAARPADPPGRRRRAAVARSARRALRARRNRSGRRGPRRARARSPAPTDGSPRSRPSRVWACAQREDPAEVAPTPRVVDQERQMATASSPPHDPSRPGRLGDLTSLPD